MRLVILESPYAGNTDLHIRYARAAIKDCLAKGESPIASHLLFTQPGVLNDNDPNERTMGIKAGHVWIQKADAVVVYVNFGVSGGMQIGINEAVRLGIPVEFRSLTDF